MNWVNDLLSYSDSKDNIMTLGSVTEQSDVFSHGQLYVALSHVRNSKCLAVLTNNLDGYTKNIVYPEVLV